MNTAFKPLSFYAEHIKSYSLLPARFLRIDDVRYIISNEVGEFLILNHDEISDYVHKKLNPSSELYRNLKSKHFLFDNDSSVALDLLSLKYRTKAQTFSRFTSLHVFVVSLRCDYTCSYCQVSRQSMNAQQFDMSIETADKSLALVFRSPSEAIKIEFQGGEPLLNFDTIKYVVLKAKEINKMHGKDIRFVITTNLSYLNKNILDFCLDHSILLSTSLDGPAELHNYNRPRPGQNGFELTVEKIKLAQQVLGKESIGALMTTTAKSLPLVKEIIDVYLELDFDGIFLRTLSPYGFAIQTKQSYKYDTTRWLEFYKEGLEYILEINKNGTRFIEFHTAILLKKLFSPFGGTYVDLQSPSGAGINALVYNYNGEIYASDESRMLAEMGDSHFRLGSVHENTYEEIFLSDALLDTLEGSIAESSPMCHDCGLLPFCGCDPVYHYATQHDIVGHKAFSGYCEKSMGLYRHILTKLEDNPEDRGIMLSWIAP